ncbi:vitamin K epoxide reductase family protein [Brachybacterium sp. ACRRE]|uniref:vitamin K epoxide reductase family protein n=1 Tax=Brachybacterium sp. ACRRE TaxID=2918184 RepID=UPI001EF2F701|nr:vitamin K epoxide reductase family protein [Brachybacterium sp. ACRRE]MCG7308666.1 vitamin K epoxide reductase family protein [Brachybacterium sp. ACRRE]
MNARSRSENTHRGAAPQDDEAALRAEVEAELAAERASRRRAPDLLVGIVLLIGGALGWIAALALFMDKIFLSANPDAQLGCDINPFISCGTVMMTWQASALGIPNMAIGLGGFAIMGAIGSLLVSRAAVPRWFRWATLGGMVFAFAMVHFLAISAIFVIHALCPWCLVVWVVTGPMFFAVLAHTVETGTLAVRGALASLLRRWVVLTLLWYALVAVVIVIAFWPQWMATFGLN